MMTKTAEGYKMFSDGYDAYKLCSAEIEEYEVSKL